MNAQLFFFRSLGILVGVIIGVILMGTIGVCSGHVRVEIGPKKDTPGATATMTAASARGQ